jgi:hypothetical protein
VISHSKEVFAIERSIEIIKQANEYSTDIYSYAASSMKFTSTFKDMRYIISVNFKDNVVTSVSIYGLSNIEIKNSNRLSGIMSRLYDEAILAISRIENEKFKKIFPDYTIVEERDDRISDILNYINSQAETETEKVETKTIFQKILEWF